MQFRALILGVLAAGLFGSHTAAAQYHYKVRHFSSAGRPYHRGPLRVVAGGGTTFYNGDLGNNPGDNFLGPAVSVGVLYRLTPHLHLGNDFAYFEMGARDKTKERGLAFTSSNALGTVFFRFDLLPDESVFIGSQAESNIVQVYVQAGAGLLLYNPHSYVGTERANKGTQFLTTERNDYPALAGIAPLGGGLSVRVSEQFRVGLEANYYLTTTDQLDDINLRLGGASVNKDNFATLMLKVDYAIE
jgi:hypothetical protein